MLEKNQNFFDGDKPFTYYKKKAEDLMAVTKFLEAETIAQQALSKYPDLTNATILLETVRRESLAFRNELQKKLYDEVKRFSASRKWQDALKSAKKLLITCPASKQAHKVRLALQTIQSNARLQEARQMRDTIANLLSRNRQAEAYKIAKDLVARFPETKAAIELRPLLSKFEPNK